MWVYKGLILSIVMGMVFPTIAQNKIKWASWDGIAEMNNKSDKKYMIYVCYGGCKWCKQMEDSTFADGHIASFINSNFIPLRLNASSKERIIINDRAYTTKQMGTHEFNELAVELLGGNMTFPSIVFMNEQFKKIIAYNRFIEPQNFEMLLVFYAGDFYKNTIWKRFTNNYCKETHFNTLVKTQH